MTFKKIKEHIVKLSNFPFQLLVESLGTCLSQTLFFVSIPNAVIFLSLDCFGQFGNWVKNRADSLITINIVGLRFDKVLYICTYFWRIFSIESKLPTWNLNVTKIHLFVFGEIVRILLDF